MQVDLRRRTTWWLSADARRPQELLTLANAILCQGQLSLAKYLFIVAKEDAPNLEIHDIPAFLRHLLERSAGEFEEVATAAQKLGEHAVVSDPNLPSSAGST